MSSDEDVFDDPFKKAVLDASAASSNTLWDESDLNVDATLDDSFHTIESWSQNTAPKSTSTPSKRPFKVPVLPKYFQCGKCKRILKTEKGYGSHMHRHKWKEAASRKPPVEDIVNHCIAKSRGIIEEMLQVTHNPEVKELCCELLKCSDDELEEFLLQITTVISSALEKSAVSLAMPTSVRGDLQKNISVYFSSEAFVSSLREKLPVPCCHLSVFSLFTNCLMQHLVDSAIMFMCYIMRSEGDARLSSQSSRDDMDHNEYQVLHYIAGAALRKVIRLAHRFPQNLKLKRMKDCVLNNFALSGAPSVVDNKDKSWWTTLMNRKSLIFVNESAFVFFVHLGKLLMKCEEPDGIRHEKVMEAVVVNSPLLKVWDSLVKDVLSDEESFNLMVKIVRAATNTYGHGMLLRKMNEQSGSTKASKATLSITHRAKIT